MKVTTKNGEVKSGIVVLKEYFGFHPNQTTSQFMDEVRALTEESKDELIRGAAKELGYEVS